MYMCRVGEGGGLPARLQHRGHGAGGAGLALEGPGQLVVLRSSFRGHVHVVGQDRV